MSPAREGFEDVARERDRDEGRSPVKGGGSDHRPSELSHDRADVSDRRRREVDRGDPDHRPRIRSREPGSRERPSAAVPARSEHHPDDSPTSRDDEAAERDLHRHARVLDPHERRPDVLHDHSYDDDRRRQDFGGTGRRPGHPYYRERRSPSPPRRDSERPFQRYDDHRSPLPETAVGFRGRLPQEGQADHSLILWCRRHRKVA